MPEIVPTVEFPPCIPFTAQVTEVFVPPVTEALNCCDRPACTVAVVGEIETLGAIPVPAPVIVTTGATEALLEIVTLAE